LSLRYVQPIAEELPYSIATQVLSYSRSVDDAAEDIFLEAERKLVPELRDQLVLIAAIRKLHAICSSSYWILYNSQSILGSSVSGIRVGSRVYSSESPEYAAMRAVLNALEGVIMAQGLSLDILRGPYTAVLEAISDGPREG